MTGQVSRRRVPAALLPLSVAAFRLLWTSLLVANTSLWMNDVAAAWMMVSIGSTPFWVALVQSASTLPVLLLGLPSGALADLVDRRQLLIYTQCWLAATAAALCTVTALGYMTAPLLLALVLMNGVGLALRWPVFAAITPSVVSRDHLPAALALNGMAMDTSRILGPLVAGSIIATAGSVWVFAMNALLSLVSAGVLLAWRNDPMAASTDRQPFLEAMRVGVTYVRGSRPIRAVLARISAFFVHATALPAMLPLVAKSLDGGNAQTFTLLFACMGSGAITMVFFLPRIRRSYQRDAIVIRGTFVYCASLLAVAAASSGWFACPAMLVAGMAWITVANTLSVSIQMNLEGWIRARGMAIYQMAIMGSSAAGAALWGQVATFWTVDTALVAAAFSGCVVMSIILRSSRD